MTDNIDEFQASERAAAVERRAQDRIDLQHEIGGQETGRATRFLTAPRDGEGKVSSRRDRQARVDADAFYLTLIQEGAFGGYIASEVFDGKSDSEIAEIVSEIEAKTGKAFEDYVERILGPDAVTRLPGESDADYHRRLVVALAEEMIDPRTGRIKPKYADDPMAQIILRDAIYRRIIDQVARLNDGLSPAEAQSAISDLKEAGYASAKYAAMQVDADVTTAELRDAQDAHVDEAYGSKAMLSESDGFFGTPDATADASKAGRHAFNESAQELVKPSFTSAKPFGRTVGPRSSG